jgi:hypothetical protein
MRVRGGDPRFFKGPPHNFKLIYMLPNKKKYHYNNGSKFMNNFKLINSIFTQFKKS